MSVLVELATRADGVHAASSAAASSAVAPPPPKRARTNGPLLNEEQVAWICTWFRVRLGEDARTLPKAVAVEMLSEAHSCTPPALPPNTTVQKLQEICRSAA